MLVSYPQLTISQAMFGNKPDTAETRSDAPDQLEGLAAYQLRISLAAVMTILLTIAMVLLLVDGRS